MIGVTTVAELNANAIAYLEQGEFSKAGKVLHEVLLQLQSYASEALPVSSKHYIQGTNNKDNDFSKSCQQSYDVHSYVLKNINGLALHNCAFVLNDDMCNNDILLQPEEYKLACGVILYNTGLAYHLRGIHDSKPMRMEQSCKLYQMALQIFVNNEHQYIEKSHVCVILAALNNLRCLHAQFHNIEECKECAEWLQFVLTDAYDNKILAFEEYIYFLVNFFMKHEENCNLAPAA